MIRAKKQTYTILKQGHEPQKRVDSKKDSVAVSHNLTFDLVSNCILNTESVRKTKM